MDRMAEEKSYKSVTSPASDIEVATSQNEPFNGDVALKLVYGELDVDLSDASVKRVLRKIDLVLLPIMA